MPTSKKLPVIEVPPHQFRWAHGMELRDTISGFKGYVTYRVDNITGCDNYGLQPEGDGKEMGDTKLIDSNRLEFTGRVKGIPEPPPSAIVKPPTGGIKSIPTRKIK